MKNKFTKALSILCVTAVVALVAALLPACTIIDKTELDPEKAKSQITMTSIVTSDKIQLKMTSDRKEVGSSTVKVVAVKAYQYLEGDIFSGVSEDIVKLSDAEPYVVGEYKLGTEAEITLNRFAGSSDYDGLYNKYYLVHENDVVKGPVYSTEIEAKYDSVPELINKSKKGLLAEHNGLSYFKDLGASHVVINFEISKLIRPNEIFEDGEVIELPLTEEDKAKLIEFVFNDKTYYFDKETVENWDKEIKEYYSLGAQITAIIIARPTTNDEVFPQKLTYAPYSTQGTSLMSLNTSNSYGFEYYVAMMEFFANRYSENNFENGYVSNYVIGNEIDYAKSYNRISEKQAPLDTYMEEYSRLMRLANLATRKYSKDITVTIPTTHAWAQRGFIGGGDAVGAYVPKQMIEWLNTKTKMEGDYNWGLAPHVYGYHLAQAGVYYLDTLNNWNPLGIQGGRNIGITNDYNTTAKITLSNIELLDDYLNQDSMKFGDTVRSVYLTESGVSSYWNDKPYGGENIQAGIIASSYYKISQLDSIKAFSYYRLVDNKDEIGAGAYFGLLKSDFADTATWEEKPAYNVYKYIDTQYSLRVANEYLQYIEYYNEKQQLQKYNAGFTSYMDLLNVFGTAHDFSDFDWKKATPVTADKVYEYEDEIDMGDVKFESKSFLYDGKAHSLTVSGTLPAGVTVEYSENNSLTEIGTQTIMATFKKDGKVVAQRVATLEVTKLYTNKKVYAVGEKIFVTAYIDQDLGNDAWVGIYRENASIEADPSIFWYSFNTEQDGKIRTVCIQEQIDNLQVQDRIIPAGKYIIRYFINGGYTVRYQTTIEVRQTKKIDLDLTQVEFTSGAFTYDGKAHSLAVSGTLPEGVTVTYENNAQTKEGAYQVKATFYLNGSVIESRYAVLTIEPGTIDRLVVNKTVFEQGEDILITATAPADSDNESWWVGLYLVTDVVENGTDQSIYWYSVKDGSHLNGTAYNIREQTHNSKRGDYYYIPVGKYKVVLFNSSGYTVEKTVEIEVVAPTSTVKGTLATDKTTYTENETVMVTATCREKAGRKTYWVGLYLATEDPATVTSIYWYYVKDDTHASGTACDIKKQDINASRGDYAALPAGKYKLVLFNTLGEAEATVEFTVVGA
ncbi:MAG TPA: hypothetical protein DDY77_00200 [Clostridiales bacterium]|nr:hypothetical protein [Clostridiales bacterium]